VEFKKENTLKFPLISAADMLCYAINVEGKKEVLSNNERKEESNENSSISN
jgi:hypothetical protein